MIDTQHPDYALAYPKWQEVNHFVNWENVEQYLRTINALDTSEENRQRNEDYKDGAVFYAIASHTSQGMLGTIYKTWPVFTVPTELEYLAKNADGAGISIYQQSQSVAKSIINNGRAGLCVSFPQTNGQVSRADLLSGRIVATIHAFAPEQVINWRTRTTGSVTQLALVVILEATDMPQPGNPYKLEAVPTIRELYLDDDGIYTERRWSKQTGAWLAEDPFQPTDAAGQRWRVIPFTFVGAENNDWRIDQQPMRPVVEINRGLYRNSADHEDALWFAGQSQPYINLQDPPSDIVEQLKDAGAYFGSRSLLPFPVEIASAEPNSALSVEMDKKIEKAIGLGARMLQPGTAVKTAEQAAGEREAQHSILSLIASNVSEAYTQALQWCGAYMGADTSDAEFTVNQDFIPHTADPQELQAMVAGFLQGAIPLGDYVRWMQKRSVFDQEREPEEYADELAVAGGGDL